MDIDKLEAGPETDVLMAERVMGWKTLPNPDGSITIYNQADKYLGLIWCEVDYPDCGPYWQPSTDIAAAWEVIEKLADEGHCPGLIYDDNGHWALSLEGAQDVPIGPDPQDIATSFFVNADMWCDTAPLTICRAALKVVNAG